MNKLIIAVLLGMATGSAFAGETSTTLKVQGTLTTSACTPTLSNGGIVDFGTIQVSSLSSTQPNSLGQKDISLSITCDSATKVGFTVISNHEEGNPYNSVEFSNGNVVTNHDNLFGLGKTSENIGIGSYGVWVDASSINVDGATAQLMSRGTGSNPGDWNTSMGVLRGSDSIVTTFGSFNEPEAFNSATFSLEVAATVQPTDTLAITDTTSLDGEMTISLFYL
jgi:type 1 fimbria pilin